MLTEGQKRYRKYKKSYTAYRENNRGLIKMLKKRWGRWKSFGGNRKKVLERDVYKCTVCGMTNEEHLAKWGREITIDHIDGKGRYSKVKNHNMDNLTTLCLSCHGKKDVLRRERGVNRKPVARVYLNGTRIVYESMTEAAKDVGVSLSTIHNYAHKITRPRDGAIWNVTAKQIIKEVKEGK